MSDLFNSQKPLVDSPWIRAIGLAFSEFFPPERGRKIAEILRRTGKPELLIAIPGHTMHVTFNGTGASLDPDTMAALGNNPTKLTIDQVFELINGLRTAIGLKPLNRDTAHWSPLR